VPKVSVIVAAYNSAAYVGDTLASVLAQTYDDWEIVLADDASTDDTVKIAASFGDRVRVVQAAVNSGRPAATRALALEHSRGELIAFLDADDMWTPAYLASLIELLDREHARDSRVAVAACDAKLLLEDGRFAQETYASRAGSPAGLTIERLLISNPVYTSALVSRAVVDEAGGIATELVGTDDFDLWLRVLELGYRVSWTPEPLAVYRVRASSLAHDTPRMADQMQAAYRRALERNRLTPAQARLARKRLRLQRGVEQWGLLAARRRGGGWPLAQALRAAPLLARVAIENVARTPAALREIRRGGAPFADLD
jgi:teichuronic acid biosynthesis glycosyltransferase TuaG